VKDGAFSLGNFGRCGDGVNSGASFLVVTRLDFSRPPVDYCEISGKIPKKTAFIRFWLGFCLPWSGFILDHGNSPDDVDGCPLVSEFVNCPVLLVVYYFLGNGDRANLDVSHVLCQQKC